MLDALKKAVGMQENKGVVTPIEASQDLTNLNLAEQLNVALGELTASNANLANMAKEIDGYKEQLASLQEYADKAKAEAVAAAEELKAKELADKKAQLADVIGQDNPGFDTTFAALQELNAEAFGVVLNGFKASFKAEAESALFNEVGVSGEAEVKAEEESETARIIKQTYNK